MLFFFFLVAIAKLVVIPFPECIAFCVLRISAYVPFLKSSVVVFLMPVKLCAFKVNVLFIVSFFLSFRSPICIFYLW